MIRYLRECSDIHLEFGAYEVPTLDTDKETILLLAGDIHVKTGIIKKDWIKNLSERFHDIVYILGNHEHYRSSIDVTANKIKLALSELGMTNVHVLDNDVFKIPGHQIKIVGGTCWTDFNKGHPVTMWTAQTKMSDYKYIRHNQHSRKLHPNVIIGEHLKFKTFLIEELKKDPDYQVIVMTHHAPHSLSTSKIYDNDYHDNGAYHSDLSEIILDYHEIKYWFHGHMHNSSNYDIGQCKVICNPRGYYPSELNKDFDPILRIDLCLNASL